MREKRKQIRPLYIVFIGVLLAVLIGLVIAIVLLEDGRRSVADSTDENTSSELPEKWQEGIISYNNKYYKYNTAINAYLLMGIDKNGPVEEAEDGISGGQSDALFLVVSNKDTMELSVISINRNTMTRIELYDKDGKHVGTTEAQICTQHGFGDGKKLSCSRTVSAVSYLFYNQPIDGYISFNMGAMPILNDSVGGVEVTVLQDLEYPEAGVSLKEGEIRTLTGTEAYYYLRGRDINAFDSASYRLRRQEQYILAFLDKFGKIADDYGRLYNLYNEIEEYTVTNLEFTEIMSSLAEYEYSASRMYTIPGETVQGESFEEFYVDDDALYEMIIDIFYKEIEL